MINRGARFISCLEIKLQIQWALGKRTIPLPKSASFMKLRPGSLPWAKKNSTHLSGFSQGSGGAGGGGGGNPPHSALIPLCFPVAISACAIACAERTCYDWTTWDPERRCFPSSRYSSLFRSYSLLKPITRRVVEAERTITTTQEMLPQDSNKKQKLREQSSRYLYICFTICYEISAVSTRLKNFCMRKNHNYRLAVWINYLWRHHFVVAYTCN